MLHCIYKIDSTRNARTRKDVRAAPTSYGLHALTTHSCVFKKRRPQRPARGASKADIKLCVMIIKNDKFEFLRKLKNRTNVRVQLIYRERLVKGSA